MGRPCLPVSVNGARLGVTVAKMILSPDVEEELLVIAEAIAEENPAAADRFLDAAYQTLTQLAQLPGIGRQRTFRASRLAGLRSFRITDFADYLIFYRALPDGIEVYHIFHGARDLEALFKE
jgi:toxin ParE1/3/4